MLMIMFNRPPIGNVFESVLSRLGNGSNNVVLMSHSYGLKKTAVYLHRFSGKKYITYAATATDMLLDLRVFL